MSTESEEYKDESLPEIEHEAEEAVNQERKIKKYRYILVFSLFYLLSLSTTSIIFLINRLKSLFLGHFHLKSSHL